MLALHTINMGHLVNQQTLQHTRINCRPRNHNIEPSLAWKRITHERKIRVHHDGHVLTNPVARFLHHSQSPLERIVHSSLDLHAACGAGLLLCSLFDWHMLNHPSMGDSSISRNPTTPSNKAIDAKSKGSRSLIAALPSQKAVQRVSASS